MPQSGGEKPKAGSRGRGQGARNARAKRPTLKDVAKAAGTSVITASRAINGTAYVREETVKKVMAAVERLGYRPNAIARGLVTRRSQSVGVIISDITNPFFPQVIRGIEDALALERHHVILVDTDGDPARDAEALDVLLEKQVDGLILCASRAPDEELVRVVEQGVPVVLINRIPPKVEASSGGQAGAVLVDARRAAREAVGYLIGKGHRRIACIAGPKASWSSRERLAGYEEALTGGGIPVDPALVAVAVPATMAGGEEATRALLRLENPPTALFAFDDLLAIGAIRAAADMGLSVPQDLAVVGFDDIELAAFISPPLTTVRQPKYEMGREAGKMMLELLSGAAPGSPLQRVLATELLVRESAG